MTQKICPYCMSDTGIRIIFYGLPMEEPDPAIYTIGGCVISENMPDFECIECHWRGSKSEVKKATRSRRFIWTDTDGLIINPPNTVDESKNNLDS